MRIISLGCVAGALGTAGWTSSGHVLNADTFFHLRIGREFLNGWSVADPGSVTPFATADWTPTQWLGQGALASADQVAGLSGVAALTGTSVVLMALCFYAAARSQGRLLVTAALLPLALLAASPGLSGRPQVASYAFVALVTAGWLCRARGGRTPWWIIPLTWFWAMTHGMWSLSIIISCVAVLGLALDRALTPRSACTALSVPVLSLAAALATPVGSGVIRATSEVGAISTYFAEWDPPRLTTANVLAAWFLMTILLVAIARSTTPLPWVRVLLALLAGVWLVYSIRTVPVAAALLLPLVAASTAHRLARPVRVRGEASGLIAGTVCALFLVGLHAAQSGDDLRAVSPAHLSVSELPADTPVLNDWDEGGYDLWRHPHIAITAHGYGDMFTPDELERNQTIHRLDPGWHEALTGLSVTEALLPVRGRLADQLTRHHGWTVVAADPTPPADPHVPALVHLRAPGQGVNTP